MIVINSVDDKYFTLNGIRYARFFQPLAQGTEAVGIYSVYDTRQQLVSSTRYSEYVIDGIYYTSQAELITALLDIVWSTISQAEIESLQESVRLLEENQYSGVLTYKNYEDRSDGNSFLPPVGELLVSYKVANDEVDPSKNGYWYWDGADYQPQASLANGTVKDGEVNPVKGSEIFSNFSTLTDGITIIANKETALIEDSYIDTDGNVVASVGIGYLSYDLTEGEHIALNANKGNAARSAVIVNVTNEVVLISDSNEGEFAFIATADMNKLYVNVLLADKDKLIANSYGKRGIIEAKSRLVSGESWDAVFEVFNSEAECPLRKLKFSGLPQGNYYVSQVGYKVAASSVPNGTIIILKSVDDLNTYLFKNVLEDRSGLIEEDANAGIMLEYELSTICQENRTYLYSSGGNLISNLNRIENDIYYGASVQEIYSSYKSPSVNWLDILEVYGVDPTKEYFLLIASYKKSGSSVPNGAFITIQDDEGTQYLLKNDDGVKEGILRDSLGQIAARFKFKDFVEDDTNVVYQSWENTIASNVFQEDALWAKILNSKWAGGVIYWCGTSIPAGDNSIADDGLILKYPDRVAKKLMSRIYNKAIGSSMIRSNVLTGDFVDADVDNLTRAMSQTNEEKQWLIDNWNSYKDDLRGDWSSYPEMPADKQGAALTSSFEEILTNFINGGLPMPDLFVIDHGHNDFKYEKPDGNTDIEVLPTVDNINSGLLAEDTYMTANNNQNLELFFGSLANIDPSKLDDFVASVNRNCYIGAMNFIVTYILVHNPRARFLFVSNYESYTDKAPLIDAQKYIANDWQLPLVDMYKYLGYSSHIVPGTNNFWGDSRTYDLDCWNLYLEDGVHPNSDATGEAIENYANVLAEFIVGIS